MQGQDTYDSGLIDRLSGLPTAAPGQGPSGREVVQGAETALGYIDPVGGMARSMVRGAAETVQDLRQPLPALDALTGLPTAPVQDFWTRVRQVKDEWDRLIPFWASAMEVKDSAQLYDAASAMQDGTSTQAQRRRVTEFLAQRQAPKTFGYKVADLLAGAVPFAGEIALSRGAATTAKKGLMRVFGKTVQEGVEAAALRAAERTLLQRAAAGAAETAAIVGAETAVSSALGAITGGPVGGRIGADMYRRAFDASGARLEPNEYGRLQVAFSNSVGSLVDALPQAIANQIIEVGSELSGPALAKLPGISKVAAIQTAIFRKWQQKFPNKTVADFTAKLAEKTAWNGVIQEIAEERVGDIARGLTPGMDETLADAIPSWEQLAVEAVGFSVIPGAAMAVQAGASAVDSKLQKDAPTLDADGSRTATDAPGGPVDADSGATDAQTDASRTPPVGPQTATEIDPATVPDAAAPMGRREGAEPQRVVHVAEIPDRQKRKRFGTASKLAERFGVRLVPVASESGEALAQPAMAGEPGVAYFDVNAAVQNQGDRGGVETRGRVMHELVHELAAVDAETYSALQAGIEKHVSPEVRNAVLEDYRQRLGQEIPEEIRDEEMVANLTEGLAPLLMLADQAHGQATLERIARDDFGLFAKILDAVKRLANRFGGDFATRAEQELEGFGISRDKIGAQEAANAARLVHQALTRALEGRQAGTIADKAGAEAPSTTAEPVDPGASEVPAGTPVEGVASPVGRSWQSTSGRKTVTGEAVVGGEPRLTIQTEGSPFSALLPPDQLEREIELDESRARSREKARADERASEEREDRENRINESVDEFVQEMTPARQQRTRNALRKSITRDGELHTRESLVRKLSGEGWRTGMRGEKRVLMSPQGSWLTQGDLTKTGLDYADFLAERARRIAEEGEERPERFAAPIDPDIARGLTSIAHRRVMLVNVESPVPGGTQGRTVRVVRNPTPDDYASFREQAQDRYPGVPVEDLRRAGPLTRFTLDEDGNRYVWLAHQAVHGQMDPAIAAIVGGEVSQNTKPKVPFAAPGRPSVGTRRVTDTPEFKRWFAGSKVVDDDGEPLVVYKAMSFYGQKPGSVVIQRPGDFPTFDSGDPHGLKIAGFFAGDPEVANRFTSMTRPPAPVLPVYLSLQNPFVFDARGAKAGDVQFGRTGRPWREKVRSGDYDGAIIRNTEDEGDIYVAFRPEQIKSATGNRGTFDPENPDIRFAAPGRPAVGVRRVRGTRPLRIKGGVADGGYDLEPKGRVQAELRALHDFWLDRMGPVQRMVKAAGKRMTDEDVALLEELRKGQTKESLRHLDHRFVRPVKALMNKYGISQEDAGGYLYARHAPERNAAMKEIDPQGRDGLSGMSDADAAKIRREAESGEKAAGYKRIARLIDRMHRDSLEIMVESGLIDQEMRDTLEAKYKHYVPLKTLNTEDPASMILGVGSGIDMRGREIKRALGRVSEADRGAVLAFAFVQAEVARVRAKKNEVGLRLLDFVRKNRNDKLYTATPVETTRGVGADGMVREFHDPSFKLADNVVSVKENGEEVHIQFAEEHADIPMALKGLNAKQAGEFVNLIAKGTRLMARLSTQWNPAFTPFNAFRDLFTAGLVASGEHGPAFGAAILRDVASGRAAKALVQAQTGAQKRSGKVSKWVRYADEYRADGVPLSFADLNSVTDTMDRLERDFRDMNPTRLARSLNAMRAMGEAIGFVNDVVENQARFSAYVNAREMLGWSRERAASYAKNITSNFESGGMARAYLQAFYAFGNAGLIGSARVGKALAQPRTQKIVAGMMLASIALDILNRMGAPDDDDGENAYDAIPEYVKQQNWVVMKWDGSGDAWTIPKPFVFRWFDYVGTKIGSVISGAEDPAEAALNIGEAAWGEFNPLGGEGVWDAATPTLADPWFQLKSNEDWAGRPIKPTQLPWGVQKPESELYFKGVSPTARSLAKFLNEATGGDSVQPGAIDVSPETLEHLTKTLAGGAGATASRIATIIDKAFSGEEIELEDVPVARRFFQPTNPYKSVALYRENILRIETLEKRVKTLREEGKREQAREVQKDNAALYRLRSRADSTDKMVRKLRERVDRLEGAPRERVAKRLLEMQQRFNRLVREAEGE